MKSEHQKNLILSLKKASGSLQKVLEMIDHDAYCIGILKQLNAAMEFLRNGSTRIVENHLQTCGHKKMSAKNKKTRDAFVQKLLKTLDISSRK